MPPKFYVEIYPYRSQWWSRKPLQYRWRAKGMNHEIMATGEAYTNLSNCKDTVEALFGDVVVKRVAQ
jgi:hypothetical protein